MEIRTDEAYGFHSRKNQLQIALTKHLSECNNSSYFIYDCIENLKKRYSSDIHALNELSQLRDNISHWMSRREKLNVYDWIVNWQNYNLISDFNKLLGKNNDEPTLYYNPCENSQKQIEDMQKQIEDMQKQMDEMKNAFFTIKTYVEENFNKKINFVSK
jgi:chaperonin cofactor prefoldin